MSDAGPRGPGRPRPPGPRRARAALWCSPRENDVRTRLSCRDAAGGGAWTWKDAVRYTPESQTIGGTSGSPVIDTSTGLLVAVNDTGNENGEYCTENNPCEVGPSGNVTIHQGTNYAEETYAIPACFAPGNRLDLTLPGCTLPRQ